MRSGDLQMDYTDIMEAFKRISEGRDPYPADTWAILASLVEIAKRRTWERDRALNLLDFHDDQLERAEQALGQDKYGEALSTLHRATSVRKDARERVFNGYEEENK